MALFEFLDKVNRSFERTIRQEDIDFLKSHDLSDDAIFTAITVCAMFNFYNRWCDGNGVHPLTPEGYSASGHQLATRGYLLK